MLVQPLPDLARAESGFAGQQIGQSSVTAYEAGQTERLATVQNVGTRALYKRGGQWIDSRLADRPKDNLSAEAQTIVQFSPEYFKLAASNSDIENQILATQQPGEELIVLRRGQVYRIAPAAQR